MERSGVGQTELGFDPGEALVEAERGLDLLVERVDLLLNEGDPVHPLRA